MFDFLGGFTSAITNPGDTFGRILGGLLQRLGGLLPGVLDFLKALDGRVSVDADYAFDFAVFAQ